MAMSFSLMRFGLPFPMLPSFPNPSMMVRLL
jgi:hypothetical protein